MRAPITIGINGPNGIGKTWLCHQLLKLMPWPGVRMISPRDFIWGEVQRENRWHGTYAEFKASQFDDGTDGRDRMIAWAEFRRSQNRHYWLERMLESPLYLNSKVVLNDSIAFPEEHDRLLSEIEDFMTIVIAPSQYTIGTFYDDNYRRCVAPTGGFRATDSNQALETFKKKLSHASANPSEESIWKRIAMGEPVG